MKPALLVLDPQNDFFEADNPNLPAFQRTIPVINAAIALFRERGWPVVFIQHTSPKKPEGSPAWEIHPAFDCRPRDSRVKKGFLNAFWNSKLDSLLRPAKVDFVVAAGYLSEMCVLSTFRGAQELGYRNAILQNGIASLDDRRTQFTLEISTVTSLDELRALDAE